MKEFAKLFQCDFGQILFVRRRNEEEKPSIIVTLAGDDIIEFIDVTLSYPTEEAADKAFTNIYSLDANKIGKKLLSQFNVAEN